MYYNQELGLCIEFGPVRVDSVRRGGGPPPGSNPPCAGSRRRGLLPGLLVIACYLSFTPSSLKLNFLLAAEAYTRFWSALGDTHQMMAAWFEAASSVVAFSRRDRHETKTTCGG